MKNILAIVGSASRNSTNQKLIDHIVHITRGNFRFSVYNNLKSIPDFDPEQASDPPKKIVDMRAEIERADGIIISTPEYVFSIPSILKNVIEWCVSTTVFSGKPLGIITASTNGEKGHGDLKLIMKTVQAVFTEETTLLIKGIKGKINHEGKVVDAGTIDKLLKFTQAFSDLVETTKQ